MVVQVRGRRLPYSSRCSQLAHKTATRTQETVRMRHVASIKPCGNQKLSTDRNRCSVQAFALAAHNVKSSRYRLLYFGRRQTRLPGHQSGSHGACEAGCSGAPRRDDELLTAAAALDD